MPKTIYTERDIEDMARRGVTSLEVDDNVSLTDLAYERANKLGVRLIRSNDSPPAAPVRPYIAKATNPGLAVSQPAKTPPAIGDQEALRKRVREAVIARLGNQIDGALLDSIIKRVLDNVGLK